SSRHSPSRVVCASGPANRLTPLSFVLAFPIERDVTNSRAPSLHGRYPASSLFRTRPPPSRLRSTSRFSRLYDLPCSGDFSSGARGLHQPLGVSLSRRLAGLGEHVTLDACRHGGMTELGDAELAEQGVMALSGHKTPEAARLYVKRTERQRLRAAVKRRTWVEASRSATKVEMDGVVESGNAASTGAQALDIVGTASWART